MLSYKTPLNMTLVTRINKGIVKNWIDKLNQPWHSINKIFKNPILIFIYTI